MSYNVLDMQATRSVSGGGGGIALPYQTEAEPGFFFKGENCQSQKA